MAERCPQPKEDCRFANTPECYLTRHHKFFPKSQYLGKVAITFRNLQENIEILPNCEHREFHATNEPPIMPSIETMKQVIADAKQGSKHAPQPPMEG